MMEMMHAQFIMEMIIDALQQDSTFECIISNSKRDSIMRGILNYIMK